MLISSLGAQGLTPLPSGPDGLGISTERNDVSTGHGSSLGTRNPEEDKQLRLQNILKLLATRVAGRGRCREGVERLARLAGFTHMWQGDTLAIAGTCVDLEITFDGTKKDKVEDVVLKIFTPESEEHKKDASDVLKADLEQLPNSNGQGAWHSLEGFARNLEYLGRMDRLSQGINCFEAIDGLYLTFRKIWGEETHRMAKPQMHDHLGLGNIGRPVLNGQGKLGLCVEYWAERRRMPQAGARGARGDIMQLNCIGSEEESDGTFAGLWTASIDCEAGYPSLRVSKEWIAPSVFEEANNKDDEAVCGNSTPNIAWIEPPPSLVSATGRANDSNGVDLGGARTEETKPPETHFSINLEPSVLMPLSVASSVLNRPGLSVPPDDSKFTTYDRALRNLATNLPGSKGDTSLPPSQRWSKSTSTFDASRKAASHQHSYTLYSAPEIWCYPVQSVAFDHPKRLAELLPTLRQYALLWTLLRSVVPTVSIAGAAAAASAKPQSMGSSSKKSTTKKSNMDARRAMVDALLRNESCDGLPQRASGSCAASDSGPAASLPIDISLSLTSSTPSRPKVDLIWPLPTKPNGSTSLPKAFFASVSIEIGLNGDILVPSAAGLPFAESEEALKTIAKVAGLCEDLGMLAEWIMKKQQEQLP